MSTTTLDIEESVMVREIFVRAVAEHEHLELHETPLAVWVERFPGLIYMAFRTSSMDEVA